MSICSSGPGCLSGAFSPAYPYPRLRAVRSSLELILVEFPILVAVSQTRLCVSKNVSSVVFLIPPVLRTKVIGATSSEGFLIMSPHCMQIAEHRCGLLAIATRVLTCRVLCVCVCLSVCMLDTLVSPAKTTEPIKVQFGILARVGPVNHASDE